MWDGPKYIIYTKPECPYCVKAKALMKMLKLEYTEHVVGVDIDSVLYKENFWATVPCIIIDGKIIGGYQEFADWTVENNKFG